jgi:hypothetical protein
MRTTRIAAAVIAATLAGCTPLPRVPYPKPTRLTPEPAAAEPELDVRAELACTGFGADGSITMHTDVGSIVGPVPDTCTPTGNVYDRPERAQ